MTTNRKPMVDWEAGIRRRAHVDKVINTYLESANSQIRVEPLNPFLKKMGIREKAKNCHLSNFIIKSPGKAMGLYRVAHNRLTEQNIHLIYFFRKGGFYLKVPMEFKDDPKQYLQILHDSCFYVLPVDDSDFTFGKPIDFLNIMKHWDYKMANSKGNRNRLQFHMKIHTIAFLPPGELDFFSPTLADSLKNLMEGRA